MPCVPNWLERTEKNFIISVVDSNMTVLMNYIQLVNELQSIAKNVNRYVARPLCA